MGKQDTNGTTLLQDSDGASYPYDDPLAAHPYEDRCRYAIRVRATEDFGNGKGVFPRGLATHLCQVGILADDNPNFSNHNDQCHVLGRFAPAYCDVGFWSKQRQAFSWHFGQIDSASRWTILLDAGGKLTVEELDMGLNCSIGLFVRGSSAAQGTGPDETMIHFINIDELAPNNCLLVKTDSNHMGNFESLGSNTGTITTDVMHSVKAGEIVTVTWGAGLQRTGLKVTSVPSETSFTIADNPTPPPTAGGSMLPSMGSTPMTVVRYSATSTIIGAAHVPDARASQSRGDAIYTATGADFTNSTRVIAQPSNGDLSTLFNGAYVELYNEMGANPTYPIFVGKIASFNDGANTITLTADEFFKTMPGDLADCVKVVAYRPEYERPIVSLKNSYGVHRINNLRMGYGRMLHAEGGTSTHPVRTIFDGVMFCGRSRNEDDTLFGPTWLYDPECESVANNPAAPAAKAIAMLYTTASSGWVVGEITAAYDEANGLYHSGQRYQNFSWRGYLNGAGAFSSSFDLDIKVWAGEELP